MCSSVCHWKTGKPTIFKLLTNIASIKQRVLKKLFQIALGQQTQTTAGSLYMCVGEKYCSFAIVDDAAQSLKELAYYTAGSINESCLGELSASHPEIDMDFEKVVICYDLPSTFRLIGKPKTQFHRSEMSHSIQNDFDVPLPVHQWLSNKFKQASFIHQGAVLNKKEELTAPGGLLLVDFRENDFVVLAAKDHKIILNQGYEYSTPADVLFYLLKICTVFSLKQPEVDLQLSGLIDKDSALYKELYQYFINISFRDPSWKAPANEYPAHFFTSLNDLALCAS